MEYSDLFSFVWWNTYQRQWLNKSTRLQFQRSPHWVAMKQWGHDKSISFNCVFLLCKVMIYILTFKIDLYINDTQIYEYGLYLEALWLKQGVSLILLGDLWPIVKTYQEIISTNILTIEYDDWTENMGSKLSTKSSLDLFQGPWFWPQITHMISSTFW